MRIPCNDLQTHFTLVSSLGEEESPNCSLYFASLSVSVSVSLSVYLYLYLYLRHVTHLWRGPTKVGKQLSATSASSSSTLPCSSPSMRLVSVVVIVVVAQL